ncbi:peptide ABC transporter ATP-binding protein, partial [Pseudomonas aeruginosa]
EVLRLERHPEHFNNLHGCLLGNRLLLNAKVYNSPHHAYGTQRLTCYDLESRGTLWGATLSAQVSAFAPLPGGQWIALALVDGQVEVRDLASGECRWRYRTADAIPLCLAVSDKLLAIGFSHGGVSLLQVAADGQLIGPPGANPRQ